MHDFEIMFSVSRALNRLRNVNSLNFIKHKKYRVVQSINVRSLKLEPFSVTRTAGLLPQQNVISLSVCSLHSLANKKYDSEHSDREKKKRETVETGRISESVANSHVSGSSSNQSSPDPEKDEPKTEKMGLLRRFHHTYKEYGKILVGVHIVTSTVWTCCFYYAAMSGLDVVPILQKIGLSETIIKPFTLPGVGNAAVAYLLYKLFTPLRYTVTIVGTQLTVKWMRHNGYLPPIPPNNSMRSLVKEGKDHAKERYDLYQEEFKERIKDFKDDFRDRRGRQKR